MLSTQYRLPARLPQPPLFTYASPVFRAKVFASELPHPRFGFVVSKKVSPQAVTRNRVKRQVRGVIEEVLPQIKRGYDILFIIQKEALETETGKIKTHILQFLVSKQLVS